MSSSEHQFQRPNDGIHTSINWIFSSSLDRTNFTVAEGVPAAASALSSGDLYKLALQLSDKSIWILTGTSPPAWSAVVSSVIQPWVDGGNTLSTTSSVSVDTSGGIASSHGTDVFFFVSGTTSIPKTNANHKHALFGGGVDTSGSFTSYALAGGEYRVSGTLHEISSVKTVSSGSGATEQGSMQFQLHDGTSFRKVTETFAFQKQVTSSGQQSIVDFSINPDEYHLYVADFCWRSGSGGAQGAYSFSIACRRTGSTNIAQMGITNPIFPLLSDDPTWGAGFTVNSSVNTVSFWVSGATGATVNFFANINRTVM